MDRESMRGGIEQGREWVTGLQVYSRQVDGIKLAGEDRPKCWEDLERGGELCLSTLRGRLRVGGMK